MEQEVSGLGVLYGLVTAVVLGFLMFLRDYFKERKEEKKENAKLKLEEARRAADKAEREQEKKEQERKESEQKHKIERQSGIETYIYTDLQVKHVENRIYKTYNFMRSFVFHIHNGEFTEAQLSLIKLTIKHEVVQTHSVKRIADNYQSKPIPDMFYSMMRRVITEGHYYLEDIKLIGTPDQGGYNKKLYDWMVFYGAKSMLCIEIRSNITNKIVAVLCMHFATKGWLSEDDINSIKEEKKEIEDIYDKLKTI